MYGEIWRMAFGQSNDQQRFAQDYADASLARLSRYYQKPREMTAADLGLPEYDISDYKAWLLETNAVYRRTVMGDTPYAFWLGAEG